MNEIDVQKLEDVKKLSGVLSFLLWVGLLGLLGLLSSMV